jgi:hypothetical protein
VSSCLGGEKDFGSTLEPDRGDEVRAAGELVAWKLANLVQMPQHR